MKGNGYDKLWTWFGFSRASFLVLPRVLMHEMPDEWQSKMADLLDEYNETVDSIDEVDKVYISARSGNRFCKIPEWILNYRRPNMKKISQVMKIKDLS